MHGRVLLARGVRRRLWSLRLSRLSRMHSLKLRPQGLLHALILRVLHGMPVHLVEVHGMVMVMMMKAGRRFAGLNR